jgi:hypothetical protein
MPLFASRDDGESPFIDWVGGNEQKIEIARSRKQTKYNSPEKVEQQILPRKNRIRAS